MKSMASNKSATKAKASKLICQSPSLSKLLLSQSLLCVMAVAVAEAEAEAEAVAEADEGEERERLGSYKGEVRVVKEAAEEILLLWALQQPTSHTQNSFVRHTSLQLNLQACGRNLTIFQSPSSMSTPGVTGAVTWDSGVVLGKFLEHAVDSGLLVLQGAKAVELGSGCGLIGCIAALLGAQVIMTDLPDRLRLLKKNIQTNLLDIGGIRGSATVSKLTWGDDLDRDFTDLLPNYVLASDVVYNEEAVTELLITLKHLSGSHTTTFMAGELRNDAVLEYFLEAAMEEFIVGHVDQALWHPEFCSNRVAIFVLVKKSKVGVEKY